MNAKPDKPRQDPATLNSSVGGEMLRHVLTSVVATITLAVLVCGVYPLVVWGIVQVPGLKSKADGSLVYDADGKTPRASRLIGQNFTGDKYFHPRPSAAGSGYDPTSSGGSNLGPTSARLLNGTTKPSTQPATQPSAPPPAVVDYDGVKLRTLLYAQENGIAIAESSQPLKRFQDDRGEYDQARLIVAFYDATNPLTFRTAAPIPADAVTASGSGCDPHISVANALIQVARVAKARGMTPDDVRRLVEENTDGRDLGVLGEPGVNVVTLNLALDRTPKR
jgi:K+-transporting ATPase ATPase C chain